MRKIPLAYFITFSCYGTWPYGDSVNRTNWSKNVPFGRKAEVQGIYGRKHRSPPRWSTFEINNAYSLAYATGSEAP